MKARKLNHKEIPAQDPNRAFRFWRDVFDLPQSGAQTDRILVVDHEDLTFVQGQPRADFELLVRDHLPELKKHLANNFVAIEKEEARFNNKVAVTVKDSEGNTVIIEANAWCNINELTKKIIENIHLFLPKSLLNCHNHDILFFVV